jgi:glycosyltransferase involved in cell wall biosynthesis
MSHLLAEVLEQDGWTVSLVGPDRRPTRWQFRLGASYLASSRLATRAARRLKYDLLITNGFLGVGKSPSAPRVHVFHGSMVGATFATGDSLPQRERLRRVLGAGAVEALSGRGAAAVVCVSESAANDVRRFYHLHCDAVIPNGIDITTFVPRPRAQMRARLGLSDRGRYALFVGRMEPGKGADILTAAASQAGFELLIAGASGSPGARHLGVLTPEALADAYSAADCVLFPSRYEACSYVVLEALACGTPLLTTRVGWMPTFLQAVPEYDVLCVEPTVDDIVDRLKSLHTIDTPNLTSRARAFVLQHNSLERYSQQWRSLIQGLGI